VKSSPIVSSVDQEATLKVAEGEQGDLGSPPTFRAVLARAVEVDVCEQGLVLSSSDVVSRYSALNPTAARTGWEPLKHYFKQSRATGASSVCVYTASSGAEFVASALSVGDAVERLHRAQQGHNTHDATMSATALPLDERDDGASHITDAAIMTAIDILAHRLRSGTVGRALEFDPAQVSPQTVLRESGGPFLVNFVQSVILKALGPSRFGAVARAAATAPDLLLVPSEEQMTCWTGKRALMVTSRLAGVL